MPSPFEGLRKYLPLDTFERVEPHLVKNAVHLKIAKPRATKLGDYRPPHKPNDPHKISVNADLNPYSFLVTLVHEIAHLYNHKTYGRKVKPHGEEWKSYFKQLMQPYLESGTFPEDVGQALSAYMSNPAASSCTDEKLYLALAQYNPLAETVLRVGDLQPGDKFVYKQRLFKVEHKLRKRYSCVEIPTKKKYHFSSLAAVLPYHE